jgi:hypothetical protein
MIAIETLQDILIGSKLATAASIAKADDNQAQRYFNAGLGEAASVLEVLGSRGQDPAQEQRRLHVYSKPQGHA